MRRTNNSMMLVFCILFLACSLQASEALKMGFSTTEITPPKGWRMSGYFYERFSTNTHDELQAKAMVMQQGDEKAALVVCDLIGISRALSSQVREAASKKTKIPAANIIIAATHTHTGPLYAGGLRDFFHKRAEEKYERDPAEGVAYPSILAERLVAVLVEAQRGLQPVYLEVGSTMVTNLSFNRRYWMNDGKVVTNPGKTNANVVGPAGPIDPQFGFVVAMTPKKDRVLGTFSSFAMHPDTVGGTEYSGDYPFYLEQSIRKLLGEEVISIFGNGTCGNINHVNVDDPKPQKGQEEAERIGKALGNAVSGVLPGLKAVKSPTLRVGREAVTVPLHQFSAEQVAKAKENMNKLGSGETSFLEQVNTARIYQLQAQGASSLRLEVQAVCLGADTAVVALPGEIFAELGLAIKKASPFKNTFVVELCNDDIGYVPTRKAYEEGGYEPTNSSLTPGGGEMLVEAAIRLLKKL
jgi:neutral ceramidase